MDTPSRNQRSSIEPQIGWLFDDSLEDNDLEEDRSDGMVVENCDYAIASCIGDCERPSTSSASVESQYPSETAIEPANVVTSFEKEKFLRNFIDSTSQDFPELAFSLGFNGLVSNDPILTITQRNLFDHPPFGFTSRVQITMQYKNYKVHILMRLWEEGELESIQDVFELCTIFSNKSQYKFCPGIDPDYYEEQYHQPIRFHIKSVRQCHFPFSRVDSVNCKLWFLLASNAAVAEKTASEVKCSACKRLIHDLNLQKKRTLAESPGRKIKRQLPSSRARLLYMSPSSQQKRKQYGQYQRSSSLRKLGRFEESEVVLNDEQNEEMCAIVEAVQPEELEKLFQEGDQHNVGNLMKNIWYTDKDRQRKEFAQDQLQNGKRLLFVAFLFDVISHRSKWWSWKPVEHDYYTHG